MEIYEFKKRLQIITGQSPDKYRAVDFVADACKRMAELNLNVADVASVLTEAARLFVEEQAPDEFLGFLEMEEAINRRVRALFDDPSARRVSGIPDPS